MTRYQAKEQIKSLYEVIDKMIKDEEILEDTKTALEFAIADMNVLQDILDSVNGVMMLFSTLNDALFFTLNGAVSA